MTGRNIYLSVNGLEEFSFIGGSEYVLEFNVFDENGAEVDITSATVSWKMSYYGQPDYAVLTKAGSITDTNSFEVVILSTDTQELSGKFIHQPIVVDFDGSEFRPSQGVITILPRIGS